MRARTAPLRGRVLFSLLGLAAALLAACTPGIGFPDPSNPVAGIPWPDYELLRYDITDQTELKLGTVDFEIERLDDEFRIRVHFLLPQSGAEDEIVLHIDARTLAPLRYERLATTLDERIEVTATYGVDADGRRFLDSLVVNGDDREQLRLELDEHSFDTDSSAWLWRAIAFEVDQELSYRSVNVFAQRSQLVGLRVRGQDEIRTPAGDFLAWQLEIRPGVERQTAWFTVDAPHLLVRWDLEPRRYLLREIVTAKPPDCPPRPLGSSLLSPLGPPSAPPATPPGGCLRSS